MEIIFLILFRFYDGDGDGFISRVDIHFVAELLFEMSHSMMLNSSSLDAVQNKVDLIFGQFDKDGDGLLNWKEFCGGCERLFSQL